MQLPNKELREILLPAYLPCSHYGTCREAQFHPELGQVPRGFLGATGAPEDVEVVMVFSEPGHPHPKEQYSAKCPPEQLLNESLSYVYECFASGTDAFHRNARWFIDQLYPDQPFDQQLRHVWLTEGRLCSITKEIGSTTDKTCSSRYLSQQLSVLPNAIVIAFGGKAQRYLNALNVVFIKAFALSAPGANHKPAKPSWETAISKIQDRR